MARRTRRAGRVLVFLAAAVVVVGCRPTVVFYGDGALRVIEGTTGVLENNLKDSARSEDERLEIRWDPSPELGTAWIESQLQDEPPPIAALSPYFSLFAADISARHPEVSFIAFGPGVGAEDKVTRVTYDRVPAFEAAGVALREWIAAGPERTIGVFFVVGSDERQRQLEALLGPLADQGDRVSVREFAIAPEREVVRQAFREMSIQGSNGFAVHMGSANRHAIELIQAQPMVYGTDAALLSDTISDALLYTIEHPLDEGLRQALAAPSGSELVVNATFARGPAYNNPQLSRPEEPGDNESTGN